MSEYDLTFLSFLTFSILSIVSLILWIVAWKRGANQTNSIFIVAYIFSAVTALSFVVGMISLLRLFRKGELEPEPGGYPGYPRYPRYPSPSILGRRVRPLNQDLWAPGTGYVYSNPYLAGLRVIDVNRL